MHRTCESSLPLRALVVCEEKTRAKLERGEKRELRVEFNWLPYVLPPISHQNARKEEEKKIEETRHHYAQRKSSSIKREEEEEEL